MTVDFKNDPDLSGLAVDTVAVSGSGGNTGGAAGDYFTGVFSPTGTVIKYISAGGGLAIALVCTASAGASLSRLTASRTSKYRRARFQISAFHSGTLFLTEVRDSAVSASGFAVRVSSAGILSVYKRSATAATLASLSTAISINTWYRLEEHYTDTGDWEIRVFPDGSFIPIGVIFGSGVATNLTAFTHDQWGAVPSTGTYTGTVTWDDMIAVDNAWVGPLASTAGRPIREVSASGWSASGGAPSWQVVSDAADATFATSPTVTGSPVAAEWGISEVTSGTLKFWAKLSATVGTGIDGTVTLKQGATTIASRVAQDVPNTATLYEWTLTGAETALLTATSGAYLDLRIATAGTT